jgi:hypothetical protein
MAKVDSRRITRMSEQPPEASRTVSEILNNKPSQLRSSSNLFDDYFKNNIGGERKLSIKR